MKKTARCQVCGSELHVDDMVKVTDPKTHYSYQCHECHSRMMGYFTEVNENNFYQNCMLAKGAIVDGGFKTNVSKRGLITTGFELEVGYGVDESKFRKLQNDGFTRTSDCTVQAEYKSPIYRNLNGIAKLLYSVIDNDAGSVGEGAGTHVNVWSEALSSDDFDIIRMYYAYLFKPLYKAIMKDSNHDELFGRKANDWCNEFGCEVHESLINMQSEKRSHPRIELRICRYNTNKQFMNCLKFSNEFMQAIITHFVNKVCLTDNHINRKNARKCAKKLVMIYGKYRGFSKDYIKELVKEYC